MSARHRIEDGRTTVDSLKLALMGTVHPWRLSGDLPPTSSAVALMIVWRRGALRSRPE